MRTRLAHLLVLSTLGVAHAQVLPSPQSMPVAGPLSSSDAEQVRVYRARAALHAREEQACGSRIQKLEDDFRKYLEGLMKHGALKPMTRAEMDRVIAETKKEWAGWRWADLRKIWRERSNFCPPHDLPFALDCGWEAEPASYHAQLKRKYERAALYPWLPVEPDPPPPSPE